MTRPRLPRPPIMPPELRAGREPLTRHLEAIDRWMKDLEAALERELGAIRQDALTPPLPSAIATLAYAELGGTKFRAGGPPAIVFVPDAPGGAALGFRDGTAWLIVYPDPP